MPSMTVPQFRMIVFLSVLSLMYFVETLWSERSWETPRWKRLSVHLTLAALNTAILRLTVAGPLLLLTGLVWERNWGLAGFLGLTGAPEILASLVVLDLFDYWWHRFNHTVPFLWRFHRVHHFDTHVDVTTSLRFHPGEFLLSGAAKALWILAWGPSVWGFAIFETSVTAFAQFHHSNFDFSDFWERIVRIAHMTPRLHAGHHTVALRTRDANFSTIFLIWDRLFGTLQEVDREELKRLGLLENREDYLSVRAILAAPFRT